MNFSQYTTKEILEVFKEFKTSEQGLSENEVIEKQKNFGLNEIKVKETGLVDVLIRQFKSPFFYLLFIAAAVSFVIGEYVNGLLILMFVLINVFIGFFQEARAVKTTALLKKFIPFKTRVLRQGKEKVIEQRMLVPGDIVLLEAGNMVPADLRLTKVENFLVDEGVLSGESVSVSKNASVLSDEAKEIFQAKNIAFASSLVASGEAEGVVINTGNRTFFGEVAKLTGETVRESAYEKTILHFSQLILKIVVSSIIIIFLANLLVKGTTNFFDFLIFCIALIVSIIPEALPAVVTFALSRGSLELAKNKMVVKRISAIEDLGDIEILCTDKTGTLTENFLSLQGIYAQDKDKCLLYGMLTSHFIKEDIESAKTSFDWALHEKASKKVKKQVAQFKEIAEIPFDNDRLRSSALVEDKNGKKIIIVKGVPEVILSLCTEFDKGLGNSLSFKEKARQIKEEMNKEGRMGRRVLAIAFKDFKNSKYTQKNEKGLTFLGYLSFSDPLKKTAKSTAELAKNLGVQIKILTGDSLEVAGAVAKEIELVDDASQVISGGKLEALSENDFSQACQDFQVFARVSPKTKYRIIESLQKKFEVGFLGEGINDAPSLKLASVAIAVGEGADIALEVSDIILLKKDLRVIIEGIKKGRDIFANINKYIKCTLASNFGNFYSIAAISLFIDFLPMLPAQILLVNLLSDFPLISIATDKIDQDELKKPKAYQLNKVIPLIIFLALVSTVFDFIFFGIFHKVQPSLLQSLWFIESIITEILLIYSIRTRKLFVKAQLPNIGLIFFSVLTLIITISLPFTPFGQRYLSFTAPSPIALFVVFCLTGGYLAASEFVKLLYFRKRQNDNGIKRV